MARHPKTFPLDKDAVGRFMSRMDSEGFILVNVYARRLRPRQVFNDAVRNGSQTVFITKEKDVSRQFKDAIQRSMQSQKRTIRPKRKYEP